MKDKTGVLPFPDFSFFFDQFDGSLIAADVEGRILSLNKAARELLDCEVSSELFLSLDTTDEMKKSLPDRGIFPVLFIPSENRRKFFKDIPLTGRISAFSREEGIFYLTVEIATIMDDDREAPTGMGNSPVGRFRGKSPIIWTLDSQFNYISFNEAHRREMKNVWDAEIREGDNILKFIKDKRYKHLVAYQYNRVLSGENFYTIDELKGKNGKIRYFENVLGPYVDGNNQIRSVRVRTTELTENDEVRERLQLSMAVQRSLIEGYGHIGISSIDRFFRYRAFNDVYRRFMEDVRKVEIHIGSSLMDSLPADAVRHDVKQKLERVLGGETFSEVRSYTLEDGGLVFYQHEYFPVFSDIGEVIGITIFSLDITEKMNREEKIREALEEKEILLKEIHFRVKNNLQIISSLLNLQVGEAEGIECRKNLDDLFFRVQTMALIHEQLYQGKNLGTVKTREFFSRLSAMLIKERNPEYGEIALIDKVDDFSLDLDTAIPLGLIFNELFINALKHGFPAGNFSGTEEIVVELVKSRGKCLLSVCNRGDKIWTPPDVRSEYGLGLKLASALASQLDGGLDFDFSKGTCCSLSFRRSKDA